MSTFFAALHFIRPWWLLLLLPALALWWAERRSADSTHRWQKVIDPELLKHLVTGGEARRRIRPGDVALLGWILGTVALAGPTWREVPSPFAAAARPAMIILKVTPSMLTTDLAPTRLDRARQKLDDLLKSRAGAPTGLVAYAGSAHLVLPPTVDGDVVLTMAGALSPGIMPREGDALADAVTLAASVLADAGLGGSILILADTVAPDQIAALAKPAIPVTILGLTPPELPADSGLADAARGLGATLIPTRVDDTDIEAITRRLAAGAAPTLGQGEGQRWEEAGYWLMPLITLIVLLWFRRGWVLA
ncbi:VWA domain-containing protein [Kaistia defluvii]|uniref:VWA domain-containing protein n=1 Tax=Kaistia defluvii TaxID=410841 RepID=UPI0022528CCD|nr:VWA domain-containing protein [Kaistia defluvii]MCX5518409.1 VWA domain-containing protein [Kaistia defluvii]